MAYNDKEYKPSYLTGSTTYQVFSGKGTLQSITVTNTAATAVALYDGIGSTSTPIAILKASIVEGTYTFNCSVAVGLYITAGAGGAYTVTWAK